MKVIDNKTWLGYKLEFEILPKEAYTSELLVPFSYYKGVLRNHNTLSNEALEDGVSLKDPVSNPEDVEFTGKDFFKKLKRLRKLD